MLLKCCFPTRTEKKGWTENKEAEPKVDRNLLTVFFSASHDVSSCCAQMSLGLFLFLGMLLSFLAPKQCNNAV